MAILRTGFHHYDKENNKFLWVPSENSGGGGGSGGVFECPVDHSALVQQGHDIGYEQGYDQGYDEGYDTGESQGAGGEPQWLSECASCSAYLTAFPPPKPKYFYYWNEIPWMKMTPMPNLGTYPLDPAYSEISLLKVDFPLNPPWLITSHPQYGPYLAHDSSSSMQWNPSMVKNSGHTSVTKEKGVNLFVIIESNKHHNSSSSGMEATSISVPYPTNGTGFLIRRENASTRVFLNNEEVLFNNGWRYTYITIDIPLFTSGNNTLHATATGGKVSVTRW